MHIIVVSDRLAKARSIELSIRHLVLAAMGMIGGVFALALIISYVGVRHAADLKLPLFQSLMRSANQEESQRTQDFLRQNLSAMAVKLGEMQAQLMRLDALGERLSTFAGIRPGDFRFSELPGRGGAASAAVPMHDLSLRDFSRQLDLLARQTESRSDYYGVLESRLLDVRVKQKLTPTSLPVTVGSWNASGFGWRIDPITGQMAVHEGIDFIAETGTPILAAAAGVVVSAELHPAYGNMVEIDHGGDLVTRYAHASKILVKVGQLVRNGEKIAEVGSTGRSTGPHLHFEVRHKGAAQNPAKFLGSGASVAASRR